MQSKATTVEAYLAELPPDRREAVQAVRKVILKNLDKPFAEGMSYGMIGYYLPHSVYPPGYHCDPSLPLPYAGLASQKRHMSLYIMTIYNDGADGDWFHREWARTGKKLDMGKCCIRFRKLDDLALDVIAEAFRRMPADRYIDYYERSMRSMNKTAAARAERTTIARPKAARKSGATKKRAAPKPAARRAHGTTAARPAAARSSTARARKR